MVVNIPLHNALAKADAQSAPAEMPATKNGYYICAILTVIILILAGYICYNMVYLPARDQAFQEIYDAGYNQASFDYEAKMIWVLNGTRNAIVYLNESMIVFPLDSLFTQSQNG